MGTIIQFPQQARPSDPIEAMTQNDAEKVVRLLNLIREKFKDQYFYNLQTNVPRGLVTMEQAGAQALLVAMSAAWNTFHEWNAGDAVDLAEAVLEDANCHACVKVLNEAAKTEGIRD